MFSPATVWPALLCNNVLMELLVLLVEVYRKRFLPAVGAAALTATCLAFKPMLEHAQRCQNARHKQLSGGTIWQKMVPARVAAQKASFITFCVHHSFRPSQVLWAVESVPT